MQAPHASPAREIISSITNSIFNDSIFSHADDVRDAEATALLLTRGQDESQERVRRPGHTFSSLVDAAAIASREEEGQGQGQSLSFNIPDMLLGSSDRRALSTFLPNDPLASALPQLADFDFLSNILSNHKGEGGALLSKGGNGGEMVRRRLSSISPLVDEWSKLLGLDNMGGGSGSPEDENPISRPPRKRERRDEEEIDFDSFDYETETDDEPLEAATRGRARRKSTPKSKKKAKPKARPKGRSRRADSYASMSSKDPSTSPALPGFEMTLPKGSVKSLLAEVELNLAKAAAPMDSENGSSIQTLQLEAAMKICHPSNLETHTSHTSKFASKSLVLSSFESIVKLMQEEACQILGIDPKNTGHMEQIPARSLFDLSSSLTDVFKSVLSGPATLSDTTWLEDKIGGEELVIVCELGQHVLDSFRQALACQILQMWTCLNVLHPRPTQKTRQEITAYTGKTDKQTQDILTNWRARTWRPSMVQQLNEINQKSLRSDV